MVSRDLGHHRCDLRLSWFHAHPSRASSRMRPVPEVSCSLGTRCPPGSLMCSLRRLRGLSVSPPPVRPQWVAVTPCVLGSILGCSPSCARPGLGTRSSGVSPEIPQIEEATGLGPSVWRAEPPRGVSSLGSFQRDPQPPLFHCSGAATAGREELDSSVLLRNS